PRHLRGGTRLLGALGQPVELGGDGAQPARQPLLLGGGLGGELGLALSQQVLGLVPGLPDGAARLLPRGVRDPGGLLLCGAGDLPRLLPGGLRRAGTLVGLRRRDRCAGRRRRWGHRGGWADRGSCLVLPERPGVARRSGGVLSHLVQSLRCCSSPGATPRRRTRVRPIDSERSSKLAQPCPAREAKGGSGQRSRRVRRTRRNRVTAVASCLWEDPLGGLGALADW